MNAAPNLTVPTTRPSDLRRARRDRHQTQVAEYHRIVHEPRRAARTRILQAANRQIMRGGTGRRIRPEHLQLLSMRHIQQAVRIVRHHRLVSDIVLETAGYRTAAGR